MQKPANPTQRKGRVKLSHHDVSKTLKPAQILKAQTYAANKGLALFVTIPRI